MKLIIEPGDGVGPLLSAIKSAKKSVEIAVFRFDRKDVEMALKAAAAAKSVRVTALIAFANRGGEQRLRKLESRCLAAGIIVARTSDDLLRYHGKMFIIDGRELHLLAFNFSHVDIALSRSFRLREWFTLQTRAEAFNSLNHVNFGGPNTTVSSSTFGQITGAGAQRVLQGSMKLVF